MNHNRTLQNREKLLAAAESITPTLIEQSQIDEEGNTLSPKTVSTLENAGMFRLKLPTALGGAEADPATQILVLEKLAYANTSASWCTMVGATAVALSGAFLPDEAVAEIFYNGRVPRGAIVAMPIGKTEVVKGGYRLSGRWPFASGIRHADWIAAGAMVERSGKTERRMMVFPTASTEIHDNWKVAGLKGTGSHDFSVENLFIPEFFSWEQRVDPQRRGGPLYRIEHPGFVANEHVGFAIGVGRRALDSIANQEVDKQRGYTDKRSSLASRATVQRLLGKGHLRLRAAQTLALELNETAWETVCAGKKVPTQLQGELRAVATHCTDVSLDVVTEAFRYAGGGAIYQGNILQQCLRDMNAAAQHLMVSDIAYENLGQMILGVPDVHPMQ